MKRLACAVVMVLITTPASADPRVDVRFVIEAQQFVDGLGTARQSVERALTQTLLDECRDKKSFPFLGWMNGNAAAPNRLVAALVQRHSGGDFEALIEFRGTVLNGNLPPVLQTVVYRWFEPKNADTPEIVKARLQKEIHDQFKEDTFRSQLLQYFASHVPLANHIDLDGHQVIVPVPGTILQADETKSELTVTFFGKINGQPGTITLQEPLDYPQRSGVRCRIKDFNFADVSPLVGGWNEKIAQVFGMSKVRDLRVTMSIYTPRPFADSVHGTVTND